MDIAFGRRDIASILFKHSKLLGGLFLVVCIVIFGGSYILPSKYKAEARILVQSGREFEVATERGNNPPAGVPYITKQEVINSEAEILSSRDHPPTIGTISKFSWASMEGIPMNQFTLT
jgi:uncharacterized protein involved in exopolysaccharide biosynthesis